MRVGSTFKGGVDNEATFRVTKVLGKGFFKVKVIEGSKWHTKGSVYETDGVVLQQKFRMKNKKGL